MNGLFHDPRTRMKRPSLDGQIHPVEIDPETRGAFQRFAAPEGIGPAIMAHLDRAFGGNPFVENSPDLTARNCGCLLVIQYLYEQMDRANQPEDPKGISDGENG